MTVSFLLFSAPLSAQTSELQRLRLRNAALQKELDSLRMRLSSMEEPDDTWAFLSGLDGSVSSLEDVDDLPALVAKASPSVDAVWKPSVGKALSRYTGARRRMTCLALGRYARNYAYFKSVFLRYGVPEELTALSIVESAVSPMAVSPAGAAGVWQLMPSTARQYGLVVDEIVDERTDMQKSTVAAARLLCDLHRELGSWSLALMGYNCGAERVRKAQIRAGGTSDPWMVLPFLPSETQAYLPSFLAVSYLTVYGESREGLVADSR